MADTSTPAERPSLSQTTRGRDTQGDISEREREEEREEKREREVVDVEKFARTKQLVFGQTL